MPKAAVFATNVVWGFHHESFIMFECQLRKRTSGKYLYKSIRSHRRCKKKIKGDRRICNDIYYQLCLSMWSSLATWQPFDKDFCQGIKK